MNKEFLMELLCSHSVSGNEAEIEKKIYDLLGDTALADQVMAIVREDAAQRRAALVQRETG